MGLRHCYDVFGADFLQDASFAGKYEFPAIEKKNYQPQKAVPFDRLNKNNQDRELWLHFYVHDRRFLPVLQSPQKYLPYLQKYAGVIGMDNSIYRDLPLSEQIHSIYLNRVFDFYLQHNGISVIPNVSWGDFRSFEFCFDGIEQGSTVAVSSYGCIKNRQNREHFLNGFHEMLKVLTPDTVVFHGSLIKDAKDMAKSSCCSLIHLQSHMQEVFFVEVA